MEGEFSIFFNGIKITNILECRINYITDNIEISIFCDTESNILDEYSKCEGNLEIGLNHGNVLNLTFEGSTLTKDINSGIGLINNRLYQQVKILANQISK